MENFINCGKVEVINRLSTEHFVNNGNPQIINSVQNRQQTDVSQKKLRVIHSSLHLSTESTPHNNSNNIIYIYIIIYIITERFSKSFQMCECGNTDNTKMRQNAGCSVKKYIGNICNM